MKKPYFKLRAVRAELGVEGKTRICSLHSATRLFLKLARRGIPSLVNSVSLSLRFSVSPFLCRTVSLFRGLSLLVPDDLQRRAYYGVLAWYGWLVRAV